jgi:aspartyl-tRNA(Asn)/glutamyl-tRNA(Gln) amidotransferase subunit C
VAALSYDQVMSLTRQEVAHLARLSRLALSDEELDHLAPQLDVILTSVARVAEAGTPEEMALVPPTSHAVPMTNVFRKDEVRPSLPRAEILAAAPSSQDGRFRVPRILEEEG